MKKLAILLVLIILFGAFFSVPVSACGSSDFTPSDPNASPTPYSTPFPCATPTPYLTPSCHGEQPTPTPPPTTETPPPVTFTSPPDTSTPPPTVKPTPPNPRPVSELDYSDHYLPADVKDASKYTSHDIAVNQNYIFGTQITYSGNWTEVTPADGHHHNRAKYTSTKGDYVEFTFKGNYLNVYSAIDPGFSHRVTIEIWYKDSAGLWQIYNPYEQIRLNFELPSEGNVVAYDPGILPTGEYKVRLTQSCIYPFYFEGFRFWQEAQPITIPTISYEDIGENYNWAKDSIYYLTMKDIFNGYPAEDGKVHFAPSTDITRREFCVLIVRTFGFEYAGSPINFSDTEGDWSRLLYLDVMSSLGIIQGYPDESFKPNNPITRQEFSVMIARAMNIAGVGTPVLDNEVLQKLNGFSDKADISDWARKDAAFIASNGIFIGKPDGDLFAFDPRGNATRAEAAVIFRRVDDFLK